jgi:hypothetical protein
LPATTVWLLLFGGCASPMPEGLVKVAFSELELKRIDDLVGGFCRRRTPPEHADQLRLVYEIERHIVILSEERPDWQDPSKRMRSPAAKFRFMRSTGLWSLYWMRANLKWYRYEPARSTPDLARLVEVVAEDRYCAFFG